MNRSVALLSRPRPHVLLLRLNRPEQRNAISLDVQRGIEAALDTSEQDPDIRALVLTGTGSVFSAGYDIHEMARLPEAGRRKVLEEREELLWRVLTHPKPVVVALNGPALGGGAMLAMCADLRVGGPDSGFRFAAVKYGGVALTWLLDSLVGGAWARDLLLSGRHVEGKEARRIGLVTRWADEQSAVLALALDAARNLAALPVDAVRAHKELLLEVGNGALARRYGAERTVLAGLLRDREPESMFATFLSQHRHQEDLP
jgi:2-(1,2-epoxy-1,2-dihydrophenyl)acetyl-CoA isomerase